MKLAVIITRDLSGKLIGALCNLKSRKAINTRVKLALFTRLIFSR